MTIQTHFHARDGDRVTVGGNTLGGAFITAGRGEATATLFLSDEQARAVHEKLGEIIAEQAAVAAAKASLRAA